MTEAGEIERRRRKQRTVWMWSLIREHLLQMFTSRSDVTSKSKQVEQDVANGVLTPGQAADVLVEDFMESIKKSKWKVNYVIILAIDRLHESDKVSGVGFKE